MKLPLPLVLIISAVFCYGCSRKVPGDDIFPPPSPPLSRGIIGYGVINVSYLHVLDQHETGGAIVGILRRGTIVEITERQPVFAGEKAESWVFTRGTYSGWLREEDVRVYESRAQAETAAGQLKQ